MPAADVGMAIKHAHIGAVQTFRSWSDRCQMAAGLCWKDSGEKTTVLPDTGWEEYAKTDGR